MDKSKFTNDPHLDSEGFRLEHGTPDWLRAHEALHDQYALVTATVNPPGWQEVDGVKLPSVTTWADLSDDELDAVHARWVQEASCHTLRK